MKGSAHLSGLRTREQSLRVGISNVIVPFRRIMLNRLKALSFSLSNFIVEKYINTGEKEGA